MDDWENFEENSKIIALDLLKQLKNAKKEKLYSASVSKYNLKREELVILLVIPNRKGWRYLAVKNYLLY